MTHDPNDKAAKPKKSEMGVEDILNRSTYVTASVLKKGPKGVYVNEVYKGRLVRLEKTDNTYVIQLDTPLAEFSTEDYVDAVEIIKREVGSLLG
jgi:hypothetical protein